MKNTWPYIVLFLTLVVLGISIWAFATRCGNNEKFGDILKDCKVRFTDNNNKISTTKDLYNGSCFMFASDGDPSDKKINDVWNNPRTTRGKQANILFGNTTLGGFYKYDGETLSCDHGNGKFKCHLNKSKNGFFCQCQKK
jgi:hypothetical protein